MWWPWCPPKWLPPALWSHGGLQCHVQVWQWLWTGGRSDPALHGQWRVEWPPTGVQRYCNWEQNLCTIYFASLHAIVQTLVNSSHGCTTHTHTSAWTQTHSMYVYILYILLHTHTHSHTHDIVDGIASCKETPCTVTLFCNCWRPLWLKRLTLDVVEAHGYGLNVSSDVEHFT